MPRVWRYRNPLPFRRTKPFHMQETPSSGGANAETRIERDVKRTLDSDTVVVILGASSGIGRAAARRFAKRGTRLVLCARSTESLAAVAAECRKRGANDVLPITLDITEPAAVTEMLAAVDARYGRIDVWVGSSSVYSFGPYETLPPEVVRRVIEVNLIGQMQAAQAAIPLLERGRGVLILIGSVLSELAAPYIAPYVASKHGIAGFAKVLRLELRGRVDVSLILPATIDTPIYQHAASSTGRRQRALPPAVSPWRVARAIVKTARRPRRRMVVGRAQGAALYLRPFSPALVDGFMSAYMRVVGVRTRSAAPTDGNLFRPEPGVNAVDGGWRWWRTWETKQKERSRQPR